jgi:uncharacterized membrane protein (DUF373 family)
LSQLARDTRSVVTQVFRIVEDVVYVGLGVLLACSAGVLLVTGSIETVNGIVHASLQAQIPTQLDHILLVLLIIELLYTVQISFREHALLPEPFLLVGLIAAIRRVLVLTAEFSHAKEGSPEALRNFAVELLVLTVLILTLVGSLKFLTKTSGKPPISR